MEASLTAAPNNVSKPQAQKSTRAEARDALEKASTVAKMVTEYATATSMFGQGQYDNAIKFVADAEKKAEIMLVKPGSTPTNL